MASLNSAGTSEVSEASAAEEPSAAGVMAAATTEPDVAAAEKEVVVGTIAIPDDESGIMKGGAGAKAADFANYFCSYAYLYHQKQMLTDHHRMQSYHSAVMKNKELFKGATVVDVGTGSGILAVWIAQAGAEKLWAVSSQTWPNTQGRWSATTVWTKLCRWSRAQSRSWTCRKNRLT